MQNTVINDDCLKYLQKPREADIALSFLDPPFNQGKEYRFFNDKQEDGVYWEWMEAILSALRRRTLAGGALYFMHREKNTEQVLGIIRRSGWEFKNLIIWKKMTSAVPIASGFGKNYQIIVFATNGGKPRRFNKLRITPPLPAHYKQYHNRGIYVTDIWSDIREMTSGYFAGDEALRKKNGERFHKQQSPLALLTRIILSSSMPGDMVFDPFGGTGTTAVVARQLERQYRLVEIDPKNTDCIRTRLTSIRRADDIGKYRADYRFTDNLSMIWGDNRRAKENIAAPEKIESFI